jgi:hypothetical protein
VSLVPELDGEECARLGFPDDGHAPHDVFEFALTDGVGLDFDVAVEVPVVEDEVEEVLAGDAGKARRFVLPRRKLG